ncbi:MAG TPA: cytochrome c [Edaphobacter sp.]
MNPLRSAFLLLLALAPSLPALAASSAEQRARGAQVFADNGCEHCHTIRKNGGDKGPDLSGVGRRLNEAQIKTQILQGGKTMPPFAEVLQKSETDDLVAYLRSCRDKQKK